MGDDEIKKEAPTKEASKFSQQLLHKDTKRLRQLEAVYQVFFDMPRTMLMAAKVINLDRANVCRHVDTLRKLNRIAVIKRSYCEITKYKAGYYTTNPDLFAPIPKQLNLF